MGSNAGTPYQRGEAVKLACQWNGRSLEFADLFRTVGVEPSDPGSDRSDELSSKTMLGNTSDLLDLSGSDEGCGQSGAHRCGATPILEGGFGRQLRYGLPRMLLFVGGRRSLDRWRGEASRQTA
jgi:hypothetical protein